MARRERLERVVDLVSVSGTDTTIVHDLAKTIADLNTVIRDRRLANRKEMRAKTTDEPLYHIIVRTMVKKCPRANIP